LITLGYLYTYLLTSFTLNKQTDTKFVLKYKLIVILQNNPKIFESFKSLPFKMFES